MFFGSDIIYFMQKSNRVDEHIIIVLSQTYLETFNDQFPFLLESYNGGSYIRVITKLN